MNRRIYSKCRSGFHPALERGLSLIELMVAMTIGAVLIFGATQVYVNSRQSYSVTESVARLQETARYALSVIEPDVRMAGYWGVLKGGDWLTASRTQTQATGGTVAPGVAANVCGDNFALDASTDLQGDNNAYALSATRKAGCNTLTDIDTAIAWTTTPVTTADTLTVRRASVFQSAPSPGTVQVCANRMNGFLFSTGLATDCPPNPAMPPNVYELHNLIVNAYYVDRNSAQQAGLPSLRRKTLAMAGGVPVFRDQEIIPGVEDMQIQFGIDQTTTGTDPITLQTHVQPNAIATRYVNADYIVASGVPANSQIVAVRIWLLVRSDTAEPGFTDDRVYTYGDRLPATGTTGNLNAAGNAGMAYQPAANPDASTNGPRHVRRLLISRTIQVRNAQGT